MSENRIEQAITWFSLEINKMDAVHNDGSAKG
jgi:hypothetical protein